VREGAALAFYTDIQRPAAVITNSGRGNSNSNTDGGGGSEEAYVGLVKEKKACVLHQLLFGAVATTASKISSSSSPISPRGSSIMATSMMGSAAAGVTLIPNAGVGIAPTSTATAQRTTIPTRPKKDKDKKKKGGKGKGSNLVLLELVGSSSSSSLNGPAQVGSLSPPMRSSKSRSSTAASDVGQVPNKSVTPPAGSLKATASTVLPIPNFHRRTASMATLPEELVVKILTYIPHFPGLIRCASVSKKWRRLATCEELWKEVYLGQVTASLSPPPPEPTSSPS